MLNFSISFVQINIREQQQFGQRKFEKQAPARQLFENLFESQTISVRLDFKDKFVNVLPVEPPPSIIFERQILTQQTIYCWKRNLTASRIHFKYWKNILISRFYKKFSRNDSAMGPE